jgi:hypothetical protein
VIIVGEAYVQPFELDGREPVVILVGDDRNKKFKIKSATFPPLRLS